MVYRIRLGGIYRKEEEENADENERGHPGMLQGVSLPLLKERLSLPPFREGFLAISLCLRLLFVNRFPGVSKGVLCAPSMCPETAVSHPA